METILSSEERRQLTAWTQRVGHLTAHELEVCDGLSIRGLAPPRKTAAGLWSCPYCGSFRADHVEDIAAHVGVCRDNASS
ncbi:MAG: hypothetical protein ACE5E1_01345 [Phycisphaerae bacterium]